jgi:trehalose-6-phosphate synthase
MSPGERTGRMLTLRERVITHDVWRWAQRFLQDAERVSAAREMAKVIE